MPRSSNENRITCPICQRSYNSRGFSKHYTSCEAKASDQSAAEAFRAKESTVPYTTPCMLYFFWLVIKLIAFEGSGDNFIGSGIVQNTSEFYSEPVSEEHVQSLDTDPGLVQYEHSPGMPVIF